MITEKIKILIVEDNANDAELIKHHVKKILENPVIIDVNTFTDFTNALTEFNPEVIISDYKMSGFNGMEVLEYAKNHSNNSNFIFITGTIYDEELAAQTILNGANGYILKKHMRVLHTKLLPYFEKVILEKNKKKLPEGQQEMFDSIRQYLESAKNDNEAHRNSYLQIKEAMEKIKADNKK